MLEISANITLIYRKLGSVRPVQQKIKLLLAYFFYFSFIAINVSLKVYFVFSSTFCWMGDRKEEICFSDTRSTWISLIGIFFTPCLVVVCCFVWKSQLRKNEFICICRMEKFRHWRMCWRSLGYHSVRECGT